MKGASSYETLADILVERRKLVSEIERLARFPSENLSPVMRMNRDRILYANPSSKKSFGSSTVEVGAQIPKFLQDVLSEVFESNSPRLVERMVGDRTYSLLGVPIPESGYVNLYGADITEQKQVETLRGRFISAVTHELRTPLFPLKATQSTFSHKIKRSAGEGCPQPQDREGTERPAYANHRRPTRL